MLTIIMQDVRTNLPVGGGSFTYYKIADTYVRQGRVFYRYVSELNESGSSLNNKHQDEVMTSERANEYWALVTEKGIRGTSVKIPESGIVRIQTIPAGLYLVVQDKTADGYGAVLPFCISLPYEKSGKLYNSITSYPKTSEVFGEEPVNPPGGGTDEPPHEVPDDEVPGHETPEDETPNPEIPNPEVPGPGIPDQGIPDDEVPGHGLPGTKVPDDEISDHDPPLDTIRLPQTGLLQWPIPVMSTLGVVLFLRGWTSMESDETDERE